MGGIRRQHQAKALIAVPIGKGKVDTEKSYISTKDLTEVTIKEWPSLPWGPQPSTLCFVGG